ncbi:MAG: monomeric [FeFe] hydrogenase [Candidatus Gastranaerophilales bacterium]|nr:monomeric [FeFe] hydrogenase [Candidatus Gastranaerophilales bacterium]
MQNKNNQATHLKKEILIRTIKAFLTDDFPAKARLIPYDMRPKGCAVPFRCCVYKERAILKERTIAVLGFSIEEYDERISLSSYAQKALKRSKPETLPLTVLETACKGCVPSRIHVTDLCQGCVARPCTTSCNFGAIDIINGKALIDSEKCKNCQKCISACPYSAITKVVVPCENACPVGAIAKNEKGHAKIDFEKCISCGKCVSICPFGAVHVKSQIIDILKHIKENKKVIALVAPAIVGQLPYPIGKIKSAIMKCGFCDVMEVAHGADITTKHEAEDFKQRMRRGDKFMTTSCCAAYNELVDKHIEDMKPFRSDSHTPLYYTAEIAKKKCSDCITVFISPCVAKKTEGMKNPNVDYVLSFEELGALLVAKKIEVNNCPDVPFEVESSKQGRNFPLTGGVAKAVEVATNNDIVCRNVLVDGLNIQSIRELKKYAKNKNCEQGNLVEIMSCEGGCTGGNACLNSYKTASKQITEYASNGKCVNDIEIE